MNKRFKLLFLNKTYWYPSVCIQNQKYLLSLRNVCFQIFLKFHFPLCLCTCHVCDLYHYYSGQNKKGGKKSDFTNVSTFQFPVIPSNHLQQYNFWLTLNIQRLALSIYLDIFKCCQISLVTTTAKENPRINKKLEHAKLILLKARLVTCLQICASICNPPLAGKGPSTYKTSTLLILEYFPLLFNTYLLYRAHCQKRWAG